MDQLAGLPNDEELEREIELASVSRPPRRPRASRPCLRASRASRPAGSSLRSQLVLIAAASFELIFGIRKQHVEAGQRTVAPGHVRLQLQLHVLGEI